MECAFFLVDIYLSIYPSVIYITFTKDLRGAHVGALDRRRLGPGPAAVGAGGVAGLCVCVCARAGVCVRVVSGVEVGCAGGGGIYFV
jgi:hypothetical protein